MAKQIWCERHWALFRGHEGRANWAEAQMRLKFLRDPVYGPKVAARWVRQPNPELIGITKPDGTTGTVWKYGPPPTSLAAGVHSNEVDATHATLKEMGQPLCCIHGDDYMESLLKA
jgi:hypothetical protein